MLLGICRTRPSPRPFPTATCGHPPVSPVRRSCAMTHSCFCSGIARAPRYARIKMHFATSASSVAGPAPRAQRASRCSRCIPCDGDRPSTPRRCSPGPTSERPIRGASQRRLPPRAAPTRALRGAAVDCIRTPRDGADGVSCALAAFGLASERALCQSRAPVEQSHSRAVCSALRLLPPVRVTRAVSWA
jgi:hypothetical protein